MTFKAHTVVQHSGFGYGRDFDFKRGLESRTVSTKAAAKAVVKAGGVLFASYAEAEEFAESEMFDDAKGFSLIPRALGDFASYEVDGLAVYKPVAKPANRIDVEAA